MALVRSLHAVTAPTFGKDVKGAPRFLLAGVPALASLLAAISITGDTAGRMARNHPTATIAAFGLAALAAFLGAFAAFGVRPARGRAQRDLRRNRRAWRRARLRHLRGGRDLGRPAAAEHHARPKTPSTVTVTVTASGLRRGDHISVEVEQLLRSGDRGWKPGLPLYGASLGPNGDGDVEQTVDVCVPPGDFDDLGARAWVGDEPRPAHGRGTRPAASASTCRGHRSGRNSRSRGRHSSRRRGCS